MPEFGRRLYHLSLPRPRTFVGAPRLTPRETAAITRKAGAAVGRLAATGELDRWRQALAAFRSRLHATHFAGIVLDYDGTVVDTRYRRKPAEPEMAAELVRLAEAGTHLAFATGRGQSVRRDLQYHLPQGIWPHVFVGYYNGAEVAALDDNSAPHGSENVCVALQSLSEALHRHPELATNVHQEDRRFQITLQTIRVMPEGRLWELVHDVIRLIGANDVSVTRSGHSVDVLAPGVSKLNVVRRVRETVGDAPILTIGDRGRWPGNDHELLSGPAALGVDEVSVDPATCWHLGPPGQRGPTVTVDYLSALKPHGGGARLAAGSLR